MNDTPDTVPITVSSILFVDYEPFRNKETREIVRCYGETSE